MEFFKNLWNKYLSANMLVKFIYINVAIFVVLRLVALVYMLLGLNFNPIEQIVELPSDFSELITRPWTMFTYMFVQYDVLHILFNMLWLYWFGAIFLEFFTQKQFGGLYILGGLGGAALFLIACNTLPYFNHTSTWLLGSSAAVFAIVVATSIYNPDYKINLLFLGNISLKWIAIISIFLDLISINDNVGGHISHLGGILIGAIFALMYRNGHDITAPINKVIDYLVSLFQNKKHFKNPISSSERKYNYSAPQSDEKAEPSKSSINKDDEAELDIILEKIKKSGYTALSDDEKKRLFNLSSKK